jgi:hypothetical protein
MTGYDRGGKKDTIEAIRFAYLQAAHCAVVCVCVCVCV